MGLLTTKEKTPEEKRISELMKRPIDSSIKGPLKQSLKKWQKMAKVLKK